MYTCTEPTLKALINIVHNSSSQVFASVARAGASDSLLLFQVIYARSGVLSTFKHKLYRVRESLVALVRALFRLKFIAEEIKIPLEHSFCEPSSFIVKIVSVVALFVQLVYSYGYFFGSVSDLFVNLKMRCETGEA